MAGFDPRFIIAPAPQGYFVDVTSLQPMTAGIVTFYEDTNRLVLKPIYTISGLPGSYTYPNLPNPMTLSGAGTYTSGSGGDQQVYYFPYQGTPDSTTGVVDLYYVTVYNSDGFPQFTRSAWPNFTLSDAPIMNQQTIDFGSTPVSSKIFTLIDANVITTNFINAQLSYATNSTKSQDELEFDSIDLKCISGTGTFNVLATARSGNPVSLVSGQFLINYIIS